MNVESQLNTIGIIDKSLGHHPALKKNPTKTREGIVRHMSIASGPIDRHHPTFKSISDVTQFFQDSY